MGFACGCQCVTPARRHVLGGALLVAALLSALTLASVLSTVFFAVTVVYLVLPLRDELRGRGLSTWWASLLSTAAVFVGIVLAALPLVVVVAVRLDEVLAFVATAPDSVQFEILGAVYTLTVEEALAYVSAVLRSFARRFATAAPVFVLKLTLFTMIVFSLCLRARSVRRAVMALVPAGYREVADAYSERIRETLFAIYVLQAATAVATFLVALPVFYLLGYDIPVTLATVAGVLQFFPIIGPSVLVAALAAYHLVVGQPTAAVAVLVVGGVLVAWLPDVVVRPRLAAETARMSGTLYFVGFVGGLLTLGVVGVIAGPLAVALLDETSSLLSAELNDVPVTED